MANVNPEGDIARHLGKLVLDRVVQRIVRDLQSMKDALLSGDDSGLATTWDEICVQVQLEESLSWDVYVETIRGLADAYIEDLERHEFHAAWLLTPEGEEWSTEDEQDREPFAPNVYDVAEFIVACVLNVAGSWSNSRIRGYLDRH